MSLSESGLFSDIRPGGLGVCLRVNVRAGVIIWFRLYIRRENVGRRTCGLPDARSLVVRVVVYWCYGTIY